MQKTKQFVSSIFFLFGERFAIIVVVCAAVLFLSQSTHPAFSQNQELLSPSSASNAQLLQSETTVNSTIVSPIAQSTVVFGPVQPTPPNDIDEIADFTPTPTEALATQEIEKPSPTLTLTPTATLTAT